ncbi:MAG TPA: hypothetical protein VF796_06575 [Humisphaera sp.]
MLRRAKVFARVVLTAASLVAFVAIVAAWVRSYAYFTNIESQEGGRNLTVAPAEEQCLGLDRVELFAGQLTVVHVRFDIQGDPDAPEVIVSTGRHRPEFFDHAAGDARIVPDLGYQLWFHGYRKDEMFQTGWGVDLPLWPAALATAAAPAIGAARWLKRRRRRTRPGVCTACGYDLRATPGRCPECGAEAGG